MPEPLEEKFSGQLLSEARKKKRLRYKRLSSELNIPEKYLQALEEEVQSTSSTEFVEEIVFEKVLIVKTA